MAAKVFAILLQLLTPSKGWVLKGRLFWTEDGGARWNDITPNWPGGQIASVHFLDESRAWVLLVTDAGNDLIRFELAVTTDTGQTWSFMPVPVTKQYPSELAGTAWVDFVDSQHGWIVMTKHTSSAFSTARLMATSDGGSTWSELPETPFGSPTFFVNATDGWTVDNLGPGGFYRTQDAGKTWHGVALNYPSTMHAAYGSLHFRDPEHGSVAVTLSPTSDEKAPSKLVLFTTDDGGNTWKDNRELPNLRNMYGEAPLASAGVDTMLITAPDQVLMTVDATGAVTSKTLKGAQPGVTVNEVSFVSPAVGWLMTSDDRLLSTADGGETFRWLVPESEPRTIPTPPAQQPRVKMRKIGLGPLIQASSIN